MNANRFNQRSSSTDSKYSIIHNLISLRNLVTANPSPAYYGQSEKFRDGSQMFNSGYMDSDPGASIGYGKKRT